MEVRARTLGPLERALHLKSVDALRELPPAELGVLARHAEERSFGTGERLYAPGELVSSFHLVVEGAVRVRGAEIADALLGAGDVVGLLPLLARWEDGLDAVTEGDTTTLEIGIEHLQDVFEDHFSILLHEIRTIASRTKAFLVALPDGATLGRMDVPRIATSDEPELIGRLLLMRDAAAFKRASMDAMFELARNARVQRFERGDVLWRRGDASGFNLFVMSGGVRCERADGTILHAGIGTPLGNLESLAGEPRWFDAEVTEPLLGVRNDTTVVLDILEDHFETALGFVAAMAENLIRRTRAAAAGAGPDAVSESR